MKLDDVGLKNHTWEQLKVGDHALIERRITSRDLFLFAHASGNLNPLNIPLSIEQNNSNEEAIAPSMWIGSLISSVLGNILPGPGTLYRSQDFDFLSYAHVGDLLKVEVRLLEKKLVRRRFLRHTCTIRKVFALRRVLPLWMLQ